MMLVIRGIIILHLFCLCYCAEGKKNLSMRTGNHLAVLRFEGWSISEPLTNFLTEELRQTISELNIFQVQDSGLTHEVNIFYPRSKDYWSCWSQECAIDLGRRLNVNYVIAGNIQKKDKEEFLISGRLFSVDMETMLNEFSVNSSGITDSLLLEMIKMGYNISGLPIPDTLSIGSNTLEMTTTTSLERGENTRFKFPSIPTKIKALMMSTALPGSGQIWVQRKYPGYGFMGTEAVLGLSALVAYYQYNKAWGNFDENYSSYKNETDPKTIMQLRPRVIKYASDTKQYNSFMKGIRAVASSIWVVNMVHAYLVAPSDDFFDGEYFFDIEYNPDINQVRFNVNF